MSQFINNQSTNSRSIKNRSVKRQFFKTFSLFFIAFMLSILGQSKLDAKSDSTQSDFLLQVFGKSSPDQSLTMQTLWLDQTLQTSIEGILEHPYPKLRLRYWTDQQRHVWFLDEIGKERPISFGISVKNQQIELIKVLAFRESRGGEIRMQAFADQFIQLGVDENGQLGRSIDGITGATMSVTAMKKIARLAIFLTTKVVQ